MAKQPRPQKQTNPLQAASQAPAKNGFAAQQVQTTTHIYQGTLPHPDILRGFDEVVAGSAQRIIKLTEDESLHRRALETKALEANISAQQRQVGIGEYQSRAVFRSDSIGQIAGLLVSIACIVGVIIVAIYGDDWVAVSLAAIPTAAVIRAFTVKRPSPPGENK